MNQDFKKCKYVILDTPSGELPILIPLAMPHKYFDDFIKIDNIKKYNTDQSIELLLIFLKDNDETIRPVSAGFFDLETLTTYGESDSLKLKPRPGDAETIKVFFNLEDK